MESPAPKSEILSTEKTILENRFGVSSATMNWSESGLHKRAGSISKQQNGSTSHKGSTASEDDEKLLKKETGSSNYTLRPSAPAHKRSKESPLSSDAIFNQSHAGLFNLCIVVLVAVNSRLIIENLMKYGLLIQTGFWFSSKSAKDWPLLMCGLSLPTFPLVAYLVEKLKAEDYIPEYIARLLHLINCSVAIIYPVYVIEMVNSGLVPGVLLMLIAITGWLKLVSYAHTNADIRRLALVGEKPETPIDATVIKYPDNITLANMTYFLVAPTLCYQLSYPRSPIVRKGWVLRQFGKFVVFVGLMGFIVEQYINPTIKNSQHPLKGNYLYAIERVLKLSVPTLYVWLCLFYSFFHLWFNIVAELTRFGDREFYKNWWNASTVEEYWRMWNMPVHRWLLRHVYFPCLRQGIPRDAALVIVFAISGIFHELCIGVPCHMFRCWAFLCIMFQVPLVVLTSMLQRKFQSTMVGNMIFWFFFCIVGQPMCILLYYHDVVNQQPYSQ
ncbi:hypothetical protein O6H91_11G034500 [Diphasiastrum complanatum]|uniref:Uncharacterized protein n=1 Tax=Diphasiastrum complanatum TaxID=34168 RepID=A0ACC2C7S4_DIPCM|nr:hypothetical protein O6H91_11G034500 [Diphasiastrum complanatum]